MNPSPKSSRLGLYLLGGLLILVGLAAVFVFSGSNQEEAPPTADEQIGGQNDEPADDEGSCAAYTQAVGELNTKYQTELNAFYQAARDEARQETAEQPPPTLPITRADGGLQNYDTELNALRATYGIVGYSFGAADDPQNISPGDYCPPETTGPFSADVDRIREIFDLNQHSAAIKDLGNQHQLDEFVTDNQVPASTGPWLLPLTDGGTNDWTTDQKQAVLADADEHRLGDYLVEIDRLANEYSLSVFEALLTDLEVRYHLSPSWLAGGGESIKLNQIYNQDPNITYYTIGHIRWLLEPVADE